MRLYSYPIPKLFGSSRAVGSPGVDCLNVVAKLIAGTTAPVGFADESFPECDDDAAVDDVNNGLSMWR